jgi:hypothetical protein
VALVLFVTVVASCDNEQRAPVSHPGREAVPAGSASPLPRQQESPAPSGPPQPDAAPEHLDIDLSLPADTAFAQGEPGYSGPYQKNKLPNLFGPPDKQKKTSINAELLRDEKNPDVIESIDGLNLTIERKLGD